ncbi:MAG: DUF86 domain-containing protein [Burkholderiales bacterium]|nr:MAG: DUF86 domain-containing protein [Burkholderiales bacterium]
MDSSLIAQKLESLRRCLVRVRTRCPASAQALSQDVDAQDVVVLNLSRAIQLCTDIALHILASREQAIPQTMGQAFEALAAQQVISTSQGESMRKAVGFRNLAVHSYDEIDWQIVHAIATTHLTDFEEFAKAIARTLPSDI